jgi:flagellar biosynthesis/type III secretory pathway chaperone
MMAMVAVQLDPGALDAIQRIAVSQMVMAVIMVIIGLIAIGGAIVVLLELRSARRLLHNLGDTVDELKPRIAPLIDRTIHVTSDLAGMTDNIRRRVDDVLFTMEELNRLVKRGGSIAEARMERFAQVLDVVQTEAEDLLLDAAATARGVHETARQLREEPPRRRPARKPFDTPLNDDEIGEIFE